LFLKSNVGCRAGTQRADADLRKSSVRQRFDTFEHAKVLPCDRGAGRDACPAGIPQQRLQRTQGEIKSTGAVTGTAIAVVDFG
jgi:hypothetical protein